MRHEYNTIRLHAAIGYVTPDDEHHGRAQSSQPHVTRPPDTSRARPLLGKRGAFEGAARGEHGQRNTPRTPSRVRRAQCAGSCAPTALKDRDAQFTALLHHVDVDRLRAAYVALRPKAAPGVELPWVSRRL